MHFSKFFSLPVVDYLEESESRNKTPEWMVNALEEIVLYLVAWVSSCKAKSGGLENQMLTAAHSWLNEGYLFRSG